MLTSVGAVQLRGCLDSEGASAARLAVVDVETTGLDPEASRVVECAIVTCSGRGEVLEEWSSLITFPGIEEIGANWLHGITRATLAGAPTFVDLADEIVTRLRDTIVVGHVVAFDLAHLGAEFGRMGACFPELRDATICTREVARANLAAGPRSLAALCARLGIARTEAHTALGDARATASMLRAFVERGIDLGWNDKMSRAHEIAWPMLPSSGTAGSTSLSRRRSRGPEDRLGYADF